MLNDVAREERSMHEQEVKNTARLMISRHGLRAQAVALEHVHEARGQGDPDALDRWEAIYAAICELRRTAKQTDSDEISPHRT
jgi:hypothetical protein